MQVLCLVVAVIRGETVVCKKAATDILAPLLVDRSSVMACTLFLFHPIFLRHLTLGQAGCWLTLSA